MLSSRTFRWLHRIGYAATLIVIAEICTVGWFVGNAWIRSREIAAAQRENTRTHIGPLSARHDEMVSDDTLRLLGELPPLKSLGEDGARFVAMPSFGKHWFALAVRSDGNSARGVLVTAPHRRTDDLGAPTARAFVMPVSAYKAVMAQTHRLADGWPGKDGLTMDGTWFAFELVHGSRVTSGIGNSAHYGQISSAVRNGIAPYIPAIARLDGDWMDRETPE